MAKEILVAVTGEMIAMADAEVNDDDFLEYSDYRPFNLYWDLPADRHKQGINVLFCDGHVEYGKTNAWKYSPIIQNNRHGPPEDFLRRRWNNDHEPHP